MILLACEVDRIGQNKRHWQLKCMIPLTEDLGEWVSNEQAAPLP